MEILAIPFYMNKMSNIERNGREQSQSNSDASAPVTKFHYQNEIVIGRNFS